MPDFLIQLLQHLLSVQMSYRKHVVLLDFILALWWHPAKERRPTCKFPTFKLLNFPYSLRTYSCLHLRAARVPKHYIILHYITLHYITLHYHGILQLALYIYDYNIIAINTNNSNIIIIIIIIMIIYNHCSGIDMVRQSLSPV